MLRILLADDPFQLVDRINLSPLAFPRCWFAPFAEIRLDRHPCHGVEATMLSGDPGNRHCLHAGGQGLIRRLPGIELRRPYQQSPRVLARTAQVRTATMNRRG